MLARLQLVKGSTSMSEESTVQGGLVDPLSDPGKAAIYFDTHGFHPDRETIKAEVADYFAKAFPEQEQEILDYQEQSDTSTPTSVQFDEYDSPLTADFAQEAYPVLR